MIKAPLITLNDCHEIPVFGLGTYATKNADGIIALKHAIDLGYRLIDTALYYGNEEEVGIAVREKIEEGVVTRDEMYLVTKLWQTYHEPSKVEYACRKSLQNLGMDYIDLYLIHWPFAYAYVDDKTLIPKDVDGNIIFSDVDYVDTWKAMENLVKIGLVKSIGVSNFNSEQICRVLEICNIKPAINQVECSPALNQKKLTKYCKEKCIEIIAYTPLGRPDPVEKQPDFIYSLITQELSQKYNKTPAQIVLRYLVDIGVIPIPKSSNKERIQENFDIFDFKLTPDDITLMDNFDRDHRVVWADDTKTHKYYPFNIEY